MKFFRLFITTIIASALFSQSVSAEAADNNLLFAYNTLSWEGDELAYESEYGTLSFKPVPDKTEYSSRYSVDVPDGAAGLFFYIDVGNYYNLTGGELDAGGAVVDFIGENGETIKSVSTEKASGNQYFHRYSLGGKDEYTRLPSGTKKVAVRLFGTYRGAGTFRLYFRNFSLLFGSTEQMSNAVIFAKSDKLGTVQVGMNRMTQFIWIGIVVVVAFVFLLFRRILEKNKAVNKIKTKPFRM